MSGLTQSVTTASEQAELRARPGPGSEAASQRDRSKYHRTQYLAARAAKVCLRCGAAAPLHALCAECGKTNAKSLRDYRALLKANHICAVCGGEAPDGVRCPECARAHADAMHAKKGNRGFHACGLCRKLGHNRRRCPDLVEEVTC